MQDTDTTNRELLGLEQRYWHAIKDKDSETAASLSDDTCVIVGPNGVGELDKATLTKMLEAATYEITSFSLENVHTRRISDDVVAIAYKVKEDLVVDGRKIRLEAFDSSVWARRNGAWVCVVHTESLAGDTFGRRRSAATSSRGPARGDSENRSGSRPA
jgi:hypothetical protein